MNIFKVNGRVKTGKLAAHILIPVVGGSLAGILAAKNAKEIYRHLKKPSFSPPSWVFPAVWTGLYTIMGIADYRISADKTAEKDRKPAQNLYNVQLGLNFLWSFLFFKWGLRGTAFVEIALFLSVLTLTVYEFYQHDKIAGLAMMPYAAWVTFALGLNYSVWKLNK
ncbi:TspO/MBR family protein [Bacillus sp. MUM 13]|uniref:TspO/MBR family protein n=1 Tax=Bacillus sp. MUM 13 TaxID=1678001 RepID=UPI0008F59BD1|nr:TspO/MBR family protein [Bacillus sp. MUM 13]OIK13460.1 TspO protein [Bacillus sp. MUM 13]